MAPLVTSCNKIVGSRLVFINSEENPRYMDILNLEDKDYKFRSAITLSTYEYFEENFKPQIILFHSKLTSEAISQFSYSEKISVLTNSIRSLLSLIPVDTISLFETDFTSNLNFFQPIELLKGQCLCDFYLNNP